MKKMIMFLMLALGGCCALCPHCGDPVIGSWSAMMPFDSMPALTMDFTRNANGEVEVKTLWRWSSPFKCSEVKVEGNRFSFVHCNARYFEGKVCGDKIYGRFTGWDKTAKQPKGEWKEFSGTRNPPIELNVKTADAKFGEPIDLLKDGLAGWETMNPKGKFGWKYKDGILSNSLGLKPDGSWAGGGANLRTKRDDFLDFNLEYDVRVPKDSNSGVYLRGRFEIQVIDSFGKPVDCHNMGAYYGRVVPRIAAEKPAGEWQHVSVTLYKRHLTVILNGVNIIDNAPITGVTGGALDSDIFAPGPIYLQGDHSDADYRNMILRPVL